MEKRIFTYKINGEIQHADPLRIERRWNAETSKVDIKSILENFYGPDFIRNFNDDGKPIDDKGNIIENITDDAIEFALKLQNEATDALIPILYAVFEEKPLGKDGVGATEIEMIDAYTDYIVFTHDVKKNGESTQS